MIGVTSTYNQSDSGPYYGRHKYAAGFVQDSWRVKSNLTLNLGLRWDLMQYWSEKYNQNPTSVLGEQSKVYPTAPTSLVYPTDPGVPTTLVPGRNRFSPRLGIQGNTIAFDEPQPPYGSTYASAGGAPLFVTPFINAADGAVHVQPFPLKFPPLNATVDHPNPNVDFSPFLPQAGMTTPNPTNTYPYNENYFFSIERQIAATVLSLSYVGSQAYHLLVIYSANPGNPALCLALSQPSAMAPGTPTCGPFGEGTTYTTAAGQIVYGHTDLSDKFRQ